MNRPIRPYGVTFLDDLHEYFPSILYESDRFMSTRQLLQYIQDQARNQFDIFSRNQRNYTNYSNNIANQEQYNSYSNIYSTPLRRPRQPSQSPLQPPSQPQPQPQPQPPSQPQSSSQPQPQSPSRRSHVQQQPQSSQEQQQRPVQRPVQRQQQQRQTTLFDFSPIHYFTAPLNEIEIDSDSIIPQNPITNLTSTLLLNDILQLMNNPRLFQTIPSTLESVPVFPSVEQLEDATCLRAAVQSDETQETICGICQDGYTEGQAIRKIHHCSHEFHKSCIDPWFQQNVHCPICRFDIRNHVSETPTIVRSQQMP